MQLLPGMALIGEGFRLSSNDDNDPGYVLKKAPIEPITSCNEGVEPRSGRHERILGRLVNRRPRRCSNLLEIPSNQPMPGLPRNWRCRRLVLCDAGQSAEKPSLILIPLCRAAEAYHCRRSAPDAE